MDPEYRGKSLQRASSRSKRRGKSKGRSSERSIPFLKGQKAFYLSIKGIVKVTVVAVHHDVKSQPYYTIKLKDGKEKQTDGKHLTPIGGGRSGDGGSGIYSHSGSGSGSESGKQQQLVAEVEPEVMTDHMTDSSSEAGEIIIKKVNDLANAVRGDVSQRTIGSGSAGVREEYSEAPSSEDDESKTFEVDQDAFYRSPDGPILKIRILSYGEDPNQPRRYAISLPDGSRLDNIKSSRIATLMDLTRKELSMLMKQRNKRQNNPVHRDRDRSHSRARSGQSLSSATTNGRSAQSLSRKHTDSASAEMSLVDTASKSEEILALPPPKTVIKMVEAKTEEGGTKMVPMYEVGMHVRYKNAAGIQSAEILGAHLDDLMEPYYSIRLEDGREKQTDNAHIMMEAGGEEEKNEGQKEEGGGNEEKSKEEASKEVVDNEHEWKKKRRDSFSVKQQPSLDQVQNLKRSNSTDFSERTQDASSASTTKNRSTANMASASVASTLTPAKPATSKIVMGDEVLYSSSQGELLRARVVSSHRDRKNRPYYVVRLKNGKEKQVYGHRLQSYVRPDRDGSRARSRSRGAGSRGQSKSRGRSSSSKVSKASTSARRGHGRTRQDRSRSESIDSHKSAPLPTSSRRSRTSRERPAGRDESSNHHAVEEATVPVRRTRSVSLSSSRGEGRYTGEPKHQHRTTRRSSEKSDLYRRSQSLDRTGKSAAGINGSHGERRRNLGRVRSRSASLLEDVSSQGSSSSRQHQFSAARHQHAIADAPWGSSRRLSTPGMPSSSKVATTEGESDGEGQQTAIAKLRSFRKSFSSRKK